MDKWVPTKMVGGLNKGNNYVPRQEGQYVIKCKSNEWILFPW